MCGSHLQKPLDDIERNGLLHAVMCSGLQLPHTLQQPLVDCARIRCRDPDAWGAARSENLQHPPLCVSGQGQAKGSPQGFFVQKGDEFAKVKLRNHVLTKQVLTAARTKDPQVKRT